MSGEEPDFEEVWQKECAPGNYTLLMRDITILPSVSPRQGGKSAGGPIAVDPKTVRKYAKDMRGGAAFPPITVGALRLAGTGQSVRTPEDLAVLADQQRRRPSLPLLVLIDGAHRTFAEKANGSNTIAAEVVAIEDLYEARWLAIIANEAHGLSLKPAERRKKFDAYIKAKKFRDPDTKRCKSLREMAADLNTSHEDVRRKLRDLYPAIYEKLRKRDGEALPEPVPDLEDLAKMRTEKAQRDLADGAVAFVESALANGQQIEDPKQRSRVLTALELAVGRLREADPQLPSSASLWGADSPF